MIIKGKLIFVVLKLYILWPNEFLFNKSLWINDRSFQTKYKDQNGTNCVKTYGWCPIKNQLTKQLLLRFTMTTDYCSSATSWYWWFLYWRRKIDYRFPDSWCTALTLLLNLNTQSFQPWLVVFVDIIITTTERTFPLKAEFV